MADLLRGFVREDWVEKLDFSTLEKVSGSYVSDDLRSRENDLIWRVRWGSEWLYVYLLLEFQSSEDRYMAVRLITYVGLLYQDLIRRGQLTQDLKLPPVLPLVLYNGRPRWKAPLELADLICAPSGSLARYRPSLRYLLIDEGAYHQGELASLRNLVAALFRLEHSRTPEDLQQVLAALVEWLKEPALSSVRRAFTVWIKQVLLPARLPGVEFPEIQELHEVQAMLAERVQEWTEQWKEEGLRKGREEGLQQGLQMGEAALLLRLLEKRFGPLAEEVKAKVQAADAETLLTWGDRVLFAETLDEVFSNP